MFTNVIYVNITCQDIILSVFTYVIKINQLGVASLLLFRCGTVARSLDLVTMVTVRRPQSTWCMQKSGHSVFGNRTATVWL